MRFTVTGASGFLGKALVERLLAENQYIHILGRTRRNVLPSQAAWSAWNWKSEDAPPESVNTSDVVIHLAGEPISQRWTPDVKREILASRTVGTERLVNTIRTVKFPPKLLISASGIGYYGDRGDEVLTEDCGAGRGFLADVSVEWENAARKAEDVGVRVVMVRIAMVLGRHGGALDKMLTPFRAGVGGRLGSGTQWLSWIHIHDLINMFMFLSLRNDVSGPVNGCSPEPVRNSEFTHEMGSVLHRPAVMAVPAFALKLAMGEMADVVLDSQRAVPQRATDAGFAFRYPKLRSALEEAIGNSHGT